MPAREKRKLAAILAADVVGYSRLVGADEEGTVARLRALRKEIIDPSIARHDGRIVKSMGDGLLVEFPSVVDAVTQAVEVQRSVAARNALLPDDQRIQFRVGVNLGDILVDGDDILGDGVNVAARLEGVAEPGGIVISQSALDQVQGKLPLRFEDLGERKVKNISRPIRIFRVPIEESATLTEQSGDETDERKLPSRPSIAVLPFNNMSGDPEQEFFADGITEDIITELSRFRELFVVARNSTFVFKNQAVDIRNVARELGVQYVVEGSVRKAGNRVRVSVQLIDATSGNHLWAERYDRDLEDIFAIQDEITQSIVATLPGRIEAASRERSQHKRTDNLVAYECLLTGKVLHHRSRQEDNARALQMLERAIELDPELAHAHAWRACVLGQTWVHGWCEDPDATWEEIGRELETALALDDNDSDVHRILAAITLARKEHEKARYHQERALSLNPNNDLIVVQQGELLTWVGRPEEGIEWIKKAMRLNPHHPERYWNHLGRAYFVARRYDDAVDAFGRISAPDHAHHAFLAACHAQRGNETAAQRHVQEVLKREPGFTVESYLETVHYKHNEDRAHHRDALLAAGLPA